MADAASVRGIASEIPATAAAPRHPAIVRGTHWIVTLSFFALLVSGVEIVISHPRFYWGETGNVMTPSLFDLPIPASRSAVNTGYGFVLPDQNGWSRDLHFQAGWLLVLTGLVYTVYGVLTRHFWKQLLPAAEDLRWRPLSAVLIKHLRFQRPDEADTWSYNTLQRLTYLFVICILFPLMIWTGLAMSPAITSAFPAAVTILGGHQSARTIHFFGSVFLVLFLLGHVGMVWHAGFRNRTRAMITGQTGAVKEGR